MTQFAIGWSRRGILTALAASSLGRLWMASASAQDGAVEPFNIDDLLERLRSPFALMEIATDVTFIQSWRAVAAPRGYEAEPDWLADSQAFMREVFAGLGGEAAPKMIDARPDIEEYDQIAVASFQDNRNAYAEFSKKIGIDPAGPSGRRILQSLRDYQALGVSAKADVKRARNRSFFWPWC